MLKSRGISFLRLYYQKHNRHYAVVVNSIINPESNEQPKSKSEILHEKILFNSYLESNQMEYGNRKNFFLKQKIIKNDKIFFMKKQLSNPVPFTLKYFTDDKEILKLAQEEESIVNDEQAKKDKSYNMPYSLENTKKVLDPKYKTNEWMKDYDYFDDTKAKPQNKAKNFLAKVTNEDVLNDEESDDENDSLDKAFEAEYWKQNYGTPDPNSEVSSVKCGGCGASLHCKDTSIPGYIPSEIFLAANEAELYTVTCQRCHFLEEYDIALNVSVNPKEYPMLLQNLRKEWALIVLMVDLLDFPCSLWPGIVDIIGTKRPVIVVGNKVDLLPQDSRGYLNHIKSVLIDTIKKSSISGVNIKHVALISAKTGYGIEELINKFHNLWSFQGDVYLVGCTNVGKSSLFNALLQSDYCKVEAADLLKRATISPWPGTTLNLLKFPILRPTGWRLHLRTQRLMVEQHDKQAEQKLRKMAVKQTGQPKYATLIGHIGRTFVNHRRMVKSNDLFSMKATTTDSSMEIAAHKRILEGGKDYIGSRWCFDTPGVVHPEQILSILTIDELMLTLPKDLIRPQTFYLHKGNTLFIAGLARIDILECDIMRLTVFTSKHLPITVCATDDAEEVYSNLLGTKYFQVPQGNKERLSKWPQLNCSDEEIKVIGEGWQKSIADVVLSSAGWVTVNALKGKEVSLKAWTPERRGIYVRMPSLIQYSCNMKGKRIQGTPAYTIGDIYNK